MTQSVSLVLTKVMLLQFVFLTIVIISILFAELFIAKQVMSYDEESVDNNYLDITDELMDKNETILFYISLNNTILMEYREMDKDDTNHIHNIKQNFFLYE